MMQIQTAEDKEAFKQFLQGTVGTLRAQAADIETALKEGDEEKMLHYLKQQNPQSKYIQSLLSKY